jgi:hypothetical protein
MTENPFSTPEVQHLEPAPGNNPFRWLKILGVGSVLLVLAAVLLPAVTRGPAVRGTAQRVQCKNNLRQIRLALESYHDEYHALPPAYTTDSNGQKLHSWRTLVLPFMEHEALYKQIDLSKPWNDPVNSALSSKMPEVYRCPSGNLPDGDTTYLGAVGEDFCFHPTKSRSFDEFSDGLSNTLMVFEVAANNAVPWMSPQDADLESIMRLNSDEPLPHQNGFLGIMGDSTIRYFPADLPPETRKALLTISGSESISEF